MRLSGSAYNGEGGLAAEGAVVSFSTSAGTVYSTFVGSNGTWTLTIPGNPGTSGSLTMTYLGRTRTLFGGTSLQLGMTPSWDPLWMSALSHRTSSGVSRNGVMPGPRDALSISQAGPSSLSISALAVGHVDYDADDTYWIASWEDAQTFVFQEFNATTGLYQATTGLEPADGWCLGVEKVTDGLCVLTPGRVSGTTVTTLNATHTGVLASYSDTFIPLALVTRSGGAITTVRPCWAYLYEGRFSPGPVLSVSGGQTASLVSYEGAGSTNIDSSSLTMTVRTAGAYAVDGKAQVMTKETGSTPYWARTSFGSLGSGDTNFSNPAQVACDSSGNIYVADFSNDRLKKHDSSGTYVTSVTGLTGITGVCTDSSDNIYICSSLAVAKLNSSLVNQWTALISSAQHITTDGTHIYMTKSNNTIEKRLCSTGAFVGVLGSSGTGNGQFNLPIGIASDGTYLYVTDNANYRVQKLTTSGVYVAKWGSNGSGDGQFSSLMGIAVATSSGGVRLLVVDSGRDDVQEFTDTGTFVAKYGVGELGNPIGVVEEAGNPLFYVTEQTGDRVSVFDYTVPPDGLGWADLQVEMFYKINAGSWVSMGSHNVPNVAVMPDYWSFFEDSASVTLASGDAIQFRVTVSNTGSGSIVWDTMNYQFRLIPLGG